MAESRSTPRLFPAPRSIELGGEGLSRDATSPEVILDPSLPAEGYELIVTRAGVQIRHADASGRRHALATLAQLESQYGRELPGARIRDWPDFPVRGYMLDVSRDRVPTRATLERIVGLLALLRLNHLELYVEHTFAYRDHELVWRNASPLTPEDIVWLDGLCRANGIELVANQNTFGHMGRWLQHEPYRHLAETPDGWESAWGGHMSPNVLAPTEESARFALGLLRELLPSFTSRQVNVGCDETFELGKGRSRAEVEARGRGRVYLDYLQRLLTALHADGKQVLFWGDVLRDHPELVPELSRRDTIALVWHYEAPLAPDSDWPDAFYAMFADFGITRESLRGFASQASSFADSGYPFWVCPGTSSWNSLIGRLPNARENLRDAAEVGLANGARGYLITDWGDNGHLQPPSVSFPPLAYGAAVSWCLDSNRDVDPGPWLDEVVFADNARQLATALDLAGSVYSWTGLRTFNGSPLHSHLLGRGFSSRKAFQGEPDEKGVQRTIEALQEVESRIEASRPRCEDAAIVQRELRQATRLARHGAWLIAREAGMRCPSTQDLAQDLAEAIVSQRACWLERSRPGGLDDSIQRLERTLASYG